ncbi:MAG: ABC transporter substrate-binding protein [Telluria sp.]|nr:ABC transporter substrate-binding protein [Telluria sp.]
MKLKALAVALSVLACTAAYADINIGISVSATGPAASLGIPQKNTVALLPSMIGGEKVNYIVLDDASDPTQASKNARKLTAEEKVDVIIGSSTVPTSAAIAAVANETKTPQVSDGPVDLPKEKNTWVFRSPQHNMIMADALVGHMKETKVKTLAFIGYSDAFGEGWLREIKPLLDAAGIQMPVVERYSRTDTSVSGQVLKIVAAKPDAVLIVGSGTPAALPHLTLVDRGYKGQIYQTHGAANKEFLKVGGKALEGGILPVGPVVIAAQLPDNHPSKKVGLSYVKRYEDKYGAGSFSSFGAHLADAFTLVEWAVPAALKKAKPGTPEFRQALRDEMETARDVVATHGVYNMNPSDHFGFDARARVLVRVENGAFKLLSSK